MPLLRITAPHFVAGVETYEEQSRLLYKDAPRLKAHRTAPMLHYMQAWSIDQIKHYCKGKDWICEVLS